MATSPEGETRFQVADLLVDMAQRRVMRGGNAIELSALNFDLLRVLVESAPNVVTYDDLAQKVWARHFVSPENVAQRIKLLRQSLGDDASEPRFIETMRGKGYRLIPRVAAASVPATAPAALLRPSVLRGAVLAAALMLGAAGSAYWLGNPFADSGGADGRTPLPNSVAILPLKNLSPDPADAYFAAGIHEEIIAQVGKAPNVSVIAQTSVQPYGDGSKSIREIATELNVETVMEGSVRYSGERVRVAANLIDPATGLSRWNEVYVRELGDVFLVQEDIATNIAAELGAALSSAHPGATAGQATTSPEAAALYLKVVDLRRQFSFDTAVQLRYLDSALAFDPKFANLYAMKADVYVMSIVDRAGGRAIDTEPAALERLALENAAKALELDPNSTRAYLAVGAIHRFFWRWNEAMSAVERAYDLSPNDTGVLSALAGLLSWSGQHERAISLRQRAVDLDPASPISRWDLGVTLAQAGRPAAAVDVLRKAAAMDPAAGQIRHWLGQMEAASGNPAQALLELQAAERISAPQSPTLTAGLLYSYSRIGRSGDVARLAAEVEKLGAAGSVGAGTWALTYLSLGDLDKAHRWLDAAVQKIERHEADAGFLNLMTIKTNPHADAVLEETPFRELRARIGTLD